MMPRINSFKQLKYPNISPWNYTYSWVIAPYVFGSDPPFLTPNFRNGASAPLNFQANIVQNFTNPNSSKKNVYTRFKDFYSFCTLQILHRKPLGREKNDFSYADKGISPKDRIQAAVKILSDGEILWKLDVMLKGPFRIYKDYKIIP